MPILLLNISTFTKTKNEWQTTTSLLYYRYMLLSALYLSSTRRLINEHKTWTNLWKLAFNEPRNMINMTWTMNKNMGWNFYSNRVNDDLFEIILWLCVIANSKIIFLYWNCIHFTKIVFSYLWCPSTYISSKIYLKLHFLFHETTKCMQSFISEKHLLIYFNSLFPAFSNRHHKTLAEHIK